MHLATLERVRLIRRSRKADSRGWLLKVMDGAEEGLPGRPGEVYLTFALPGQARGHHYHRLTSEWFTVVLGQATLELLELGSLRRQTYRLSADDPITVYVPAGVAHTFKNPPDAGEPFVLVAYADRPYDPADTFSLEEPL